MFFTCCSFASRSHSSAPVFLPPPKLVPRVHLWTTPSGHLCPHTQFISFSRPCDCTRVQTCKIGLVRSLFFFSCMDCPYPPACPWLPPSPKNFVRFPTPLFHRFFSLVLLPLLSPLTATHISIVPFGANPPPKPCVFFFSRYFSNHPGLVPPPPPLSFPPPLRNSLSHNYFCFEHFCLP